MTDDNGKLISREWRPVNDKGLVRQIDVYQKPDGSFYNMSVYTKGPSSYVEGGKLEKINV